MVDEKTLCLRVLFLACGCWLKGVSGTGLKHDFVFPKNMDWDVFGKMAYYHNIEALLYVLLTKKSLPGDSIPSQLYKEWEKAYFTNLIRNSEAVSMLKDLLDECRLKHIPVVVLKGPASLAQVYEGNTGIRPMADLDLLCRKQDLMALSDTAYSLGCHKPGFIRLHHLVMTHEMLGIYLEFHYNLYHFMKNKKEFLSSVWENTQPARLEGLEFQVMPFEAQLVFEAGHFLAHRGFVSLKHYLDFAAKLVLWKDKLDGKELERLLRLTGVRNEFISVSAALPEWLGLHPELFFSLASFPTRNPDVSTKKRFELSASIGFINLKAPGAELAGQRGLWKKSIFLFKRLFPPLSAIQAAYGLPSRRKAFLSIPRHLRDALRDFRERKSAEGQVKNRSWTA